MRDGQMSKLKVDENELTIGEPRPSRRWRPWPARIGDSVRCDQSKMWSSKGPEYIQRTSRCLDSIFTPMLHSKIYCLSRIVESQPFPTGHRNEMIAYAAARPLWQTQSPKNSWWWGGVVYQFVIRSIYFVPFICNRLCCLVYVAVYHVVARALGVIVVTLRTLVLGTMIDNVPCSIVQNFLQCLASRKAQLSNTTA